MKAGATGMGSGVDDVLARLRAAADPNRREKTEGYFPSRMEIYGVAVPQIRAVLRPLAAALRPRPGKEVLRMARALLATNVHEARQVAFELVGGRRDVVANLDATAVERLGKGNDNWGSVDCFSVFVAGPAWRDGRVTDADVLRWCRSEDLWWRRTALVATVPLNMKSRGGTGDPERTVAVCNAVASDREAMVVKGLSWALRSLVPVDREAVAAFLEHHGDSLAPLVRREVGNKMATGLKNPEKR